MRASVTAFVILISTCVVNASLLDPVIENVFHRQATKLPSGVSGIWKKKTIWKPWWMKEWKSAKVMKPVWRKVWSPVQIKEWVPMPKPPPGWDSTSTPLAPVNPAPSDNSALLWDPIPYPESQQPPPLPQQSSYHAEDPCARGGCDNSHSLAFNREQISGIIGSGGYKDHHEYSETVTHLTRVPPAPNNWKSPSEPPRLHPDNFPELPPFLIPPRFQTISDSNYKSVQQPPAVQTPQWHPPPSQTSPKGHFVTKAPVQPPKGGGSDKENQPPDGELKGKPGFQTHHAHPHNDFIQEAQLVGEYHYSEFDLKPTEQRPPRGKEKPRQTRTETKQQQPPRHSSDFQVQKADAKEIIPSFKPLGVHVPPPGFPSNHRFAPPPEKKRPNQNGTPTADRHESSNPTRPAKPNFSNFSVRVVSSNTSTKSAQQINNHTTTESPPQAQHPGAALDKPIFRDDHNVHIVWSKPPPNAPSTTQAPEATAATTSRPQYTPPIFGDDFNLHVIYSKPPPLTQVHNQTTTPPAPTSSSPSTTESTATNSPVYVVTPVTSIKL